MKKIFRVRILDKEGRNTVNSAYFIDRTDAEFYRNRFENTAVHTSTSIDEFEEWEKGEYHPDKDIKQRALSKLTAEERKALGLE